MRIRNKKTESLCHTMHMHILRRHAANATIGTIVHDHAQERPSSNSIFDRQDSSIVMQIEMDDLERLQSERPQVSVYLLRYMLGIEAAQAAVEANYRQLDNPVVETPAHVDGWLKANDST